MDDGDEAEPSPQTLSPRSPVSPNSSKEIPAQCANTPMYPYIADLYAPGSTCFTHLPGIGWAQQAAEDLSGNVFSIVPLWHGIADIAVENAGVDNLHQTIADSYILDAWLSWCIQSLIHGGIFAMVAGPRNVGPMARLFFSFGKRISGLPVARLRTLVRRFALQVPFALWHSLSRAGFCGLVGTGLLYTRLMPPFFALGSPASLLYTNGFIKL